VLVVSAGSPAGAAALARLVGLPVVLMLDGRDVPAAVFEADPCAVLPADLPAGALTLRLASAIERGRAAGSDRLASSAVEAAPGAIVLTDAEGRIRHANAAFARVAGGAPRDPGGAALDTLIVPEGDPAMHARFFEAVRGHGEWIGDATLLAGGSGVAVRVGVAPMSAAGDTSSGAVTVLLDLTDHRALEESLREANRILRRQAFLDPLTGLFNRAYLRDALEREVSRARRYETPLAVLMVDLDCFKGVNDRWGHAAGDEVLRSVAAALRAGLREGDVLARYGGDEFCALLPSTAIEDARLAAGRIRERVRAVAVRGDPKATLGASVGVATTADLELTQEPDMLVRLADRALLAAKRAGGDRVLDASSFEARSIAWGDLGA
jgi:diguanylate cyclase (GGDEF)-like protein/PAS domain S-box-containing protein